MGRLQQTCYSLEAELASIKVSAAGATADLEEQLRHQQDLTSGLEVELLVVREGAERNQLQLKAQLVALAETISRLEEELRCQSDLTSCHLDTISELEGQVHGLQEQVEVKAMELVRVREELQRKGDEMEETLDEQEQRMQQLQQLALSMQEVAEKHAGSLQRRLEEVRSGLHTALLC